MHVAVDRGRVDDRLELQVFDQHIGQARALGQLEHLVQHTAPQVGVHHQDLETLVSEGRRQIDDARRLPVTLARAGHDDRPRHLIGGGERDVRSKAAERLGDGVLRVATDDEPGGEVLVGVAGGRQPGSRPARQEPPLAVGELVVPHVGYHSQNRHSGQCLDLVHRVDGVVEVLASERRADTDHQSQPDGQQQVPDLVRAHRPGGHDRGIDDGGVRRLDGLRDLGLLQVGLQQPEDSLEQRGLSQQALVFRFPAGKLRHLRGSLLKL